MGVFLDFVKLIWNDDIQTLITLLIILEITGKTVIKKILLQDLYFYFGNKKHASLTRQFWLVFKKNIQHAASYTLFTNFGLTEAEQELLVSTWEQQLRKHFYNCQTQQLLVCLPQLHILFQHQLQ